MIDQGSFRTVRFEGAGAGEAPLTWAQVDVWQSSTDSGGAVTIAGAYPVPGGTTVEQVLDILGFIMGRHQALRTRLRFGPDGRPSQVCAASGEAALLVVAASGEPDVFAQQLKLHLEQQPFDYEQDWPVRMAAVTVAGLVTHVVTIYLHLAVDAGGIEALLADLADRDPVTGDAAGPITAMQPLQLARRQAGPVAQRQSAASLKHLEHALRMAPPRMFGVPELAGPGQYRKLSYRSTACWLAAQRVATERCVTTSSVLLAMFAVALARQLCQPTIWTMVLVNNRFRPGLADSVSQLAQSSPYLIELAGLDLATAVARTQANLLQTYKTAYYDRYRHDELVAALSRELPEPVEMCCYYNDRGGPAAGAGSSTDAQLRDALALSSWHEVSEATLPAAPMFMNLSYPAGLVEFQVSFDACYFGMDDILAVVREIEAAAVETAVRPNSPVGAPTLVHQDA